jgi:hypothetical protein
LLNSPGGAAGEPRQLIKRRRHLLLAHVSCTNKQIAFVDDLCHLLQICTDPPAAPTVAAHATMGGALALRVSPTTTRQ